MSPPSRRWSDDSTTLLLLGLVGLLTCQAAAPVVWYMTHQHRVRCAARGEVPDRWARVAGVLSILGTGLLGVGVLVWIALAVLVAISGL